MIFLQWKTFIELLPSSIRVFMWWQVAKIMRDLINHTAAVTMQTTCAMPPMVLMASLNLAHETRWKPRGSISISLNLSSFIFFYLRQKLKKVWVRMSQKIKLSRFSTRSVGCQVENVNLNLWAPEGLESWSKCLRWGIWPSRFHWSRLKWRAAWRYDGSVT